MSESVWEGDEDYDPMEQDYNDPTFNSYKSGPGSYISPHLHTQKGWKEKDSAFKLHVSNIPMDIKETGFFNVFSNFGKPVSLYLAVAKSGSTKWGFIQFRTLREAERAIYCVNKVPPLKLNVKFALTDEAKANRARFSTATPAGAVDDLTQYKQPADNVSGNVGKGRGLPLPPLQGIKPSNMSSSYVWYSPYLSLCSQSLESHPLGEFSINISDEIIELYNEALTFEKPVVKNNGKYVMYMGRGYALKALIDHSERFVLGQKDFKFSEDATIQKQPCAVCSEEAMRICINCSLWYCSKICFRTDSPNHIINISGLIICYNVHKNEAKENSKYNKSSADRGRYVQRLIFPPINSGKENLTKSSSDITEKKLTNLIGNRNSYLNPTHFIRHIDELQYESKNLNCVGSLGKSLSGSLSDCCPLNSGFCTEVQISHQVDNSVYWVTKESDSEKILEITKKLHKHCSDRKTKHLLTVLPSSKCAALLNKFWYRAEIISRKDHDVKIRLIDVGLEETCTFKNLRILPGEMLDIPPFAFKIKFMDGISSKYEKLAEGHKVKMKLVSMDKDGCLIVQDDNEISSISSSGNDLNISITNIDGPLPNNVFSEVVIAYCVNKNNYWVNLISQWNDLNEMSTLLNMIGDRSQSVLSPALHHIYIKLFDSHWCRAKVTCLNPLRVFYIDYGNEEEVSNQTELHMLPSMLTTRFPPMAVRIQIAEGTNKKYLDSQISQHLRIKPLSKDEECYIVTVESDEYSESDNSLTADNISKHLTCKEGPAKHLLFTLETGLRFTIVVNQVMSSNRFTGSLIINSKNSVLHIVEDKLAEVTAGTAENLKLGDSVGCLTVDGLCARGYLTSIINNTRRVALVDYGLVAIADKLCQLPMSLDNEPEAGVSCKVSRPHSDLQIGCKIRCSQAQLKGKEIHCYSESFGNLVLSIWRPKIEDGGLASVIIPSGSRVVISSYKTPQVIYVQSLEQTQKMLFDTLMQDVAAYAASAPCLNREPQVGELVACLFPEDQNFYRAQVCRKRDNLYTVTYVDFGNTFDVTSQDMRVLDDRLKMVPCCAIKVGLKGVAESILTSNSVYFLNMLCSKENETLFLEYEDSLKNSVLKSNEGVSLNSKLTEMIALNWKKCLEEGIDPTNGMVFFGDDVNYIRWDIGTKIKLLIVGQICVNCYFVINSQDGLLDFMRDWFTPRVSEYCSSFAKHYSYTPRLREICFVKFLDDNLWYRAVVTNTFDISCWVVFLDFGNTGEVYYKNIRPMTDEFIRVPAILKKCIIEGLPNEYPNEVGRKRLNELITLGSIHDTIITKESNNGSVTAYFHSIASIASEIGLPPIKPPST